jgi:hypothetical protein
VAGARPRAAPAGWSVVGPLGGPATLERAGTDVAEGLEYEDRGEGEPVLLIHGAVIADAFMPLSRERLIGPIELPLGDAD